MSGIKTLGFAPRVPSGGAVMRQVKWFFFSFDGRISRKPFWLLHLAVFALYVIARLIISGEFTIKQDAFLKIFLMIFLWPILAVEAKRWHDRNKSAWWLLISAVPIIGGIWALVETGLLEGTTGENQYGKDPLEGVEKGVAITRQLTTKEIAWAAGVFVLLILTLFGWLLFQVFSDANK